MLRFPSKIVCPLSDRTPRDIATYMMFMRTLDRQRSIPFSKKQVNSSIQCILQVVTKRRGSWAGRQEPAGSQRRHTHRRGKSARQRMPTTPHEPTTQTTHQGAAHASNQDTTNASLHCTPSRRHSQTRKAQPLSRAKVPP